MNSKLLIGKGNNKGRRARLDVQTSYNLWRKHYIQHLENLYDIFRESKTGERIEFDEFCRFVYLNSSKYLCPWI